MTNISKERGKVISYIVYILRLRFYTVYLFNISLNSSGWTLVFKAIAGVPGVMSDIWQSYATFKENSLEALNIGNSFKNHYKNRIVQEWSLFSPTQVRKEKIILCTVWN